MYLLTLSYSNIYMHIHVHISISIMTEKETYKKIVLVYTPRSSPWKYKFPSTISNTREYHV